MSDETGVDSRTREETEKVRAQHDGLIQGQARPAADRWQRRTDNEFKSPSR
jgi:hypothetical protein